MEIDKKKLYKYIAFFGLFVAAIIAITIIHFATKTEVKINLKITVAPQTAEILVGEESYKNGDYTVEPGNYHVKLSKDGFNTQEMDIEIKEDDVSYIYVALEQTDGTTSWYEEHPEDAALLDAIFSYNTTENAAKIAEKYPLTTRLPIKIDQYSSDYSDYTRYEVTYEVINNDKVIIIIKDYTGGNEKSAKEKIRARGFDPDDYEIRYEDLSEDLTWGHAH